MINTKLIDKGNILRCFAMLLKDQLLQKSKWERKIVVENII